MVEALDPLTRIAIARGTDKYGTHFYTPHYHRWLSHLRERPITFLELGVGGYDNPESGGASLRMWRDYFPRARIVGVDVFEKRLADAERIEIRTGSQSDPGFVATLVAEFGDFDVIVDDGSHRSADVIASFKLLFPHLVDGGIYIVEDTAASYWPSFGGGESPGLPTSMNYAKDLFDAIDDVDRRGRRPEDSPAHSIRVMSRLRNLLILERGRNDEPITRSTVPSHPELEAAIAAYDEIAPTAADENAVLMLASLLERARRPREALDRLEARICAGPSPSILFAAARIAAGLDDLDSARGHLRRAIATVESDLAPFVLAAETEGLLDVLKSAAPRFEAVRAAGERTPRRLLEAGSVRLALGDEDGAARDFAEALRVRVPLAARRLAAAADFFARRGDEGLAHNAFARAVEAAPHDADLAVRHATFLFRCGEAERAEVEVDRALACAPRHLRGWILRARLLAQAGRAEEAFSAFKSAGEAIADAGAPPAFIKRRWRG